MRDSYSNTRGFNQQPSYGSSALKLWLNLDAKQIIVPAQDFRLLVVE